MTASETNERSGLAATFAALVGIFVGAWLYDVYLVGSSTFYLGLKMGVNLLLAFVLLKFTSRSRFLELVAVAVFFALIFSTGIGAVELGFRFYSGHGL